MSLPTFTWGELDVCEFSDVLNLAYTTTVHWRTNCFIPRVGKRFISELANMYLSIGTASALESVALKATIVLRHLLLQYPHKKSKMRDHTSCLERHVEVWWSSKLAIGRYCNSTKTTSTPDTARSFAKLMFTGKCKAALDLLNNSSSGRSSRPQWPPFYECQTDVN